MEKIKMKQASFMNTVHGKTQISAHHYLIVCALSFTAFFYSCVDNPVPEKIFEDKPLPSLSERPNITDVIPAVEAGDGVREIQIRGTRLGLKNGTDTNWLYIGGIKPIYKQITDSLITIYRPNLSDDKYGGTIYFNITDPAFEGQSSSKEYIIQRPGAIVGDYTGVGVMLAFDFDQKENLYVIAANRNFYRTDSAGVTQTTILTSGNLTIGELASTTDMAFGPGDSLKNLYLITGRSYIARQKWTVDVPAVSNKVVRIPLTMDVAKMDFDEIGNIYAGGSTGIYRIDSSIASIPATGTPTVSASLGYAGLNIKQIRIIKLGATNYIYVADSLRVWRSPILGDGTLAGQEQMLTLTGTAYGDSNFINSFALDVNGGIFLCLRRHAKYSLFVQEGDGSITPYYTDVILPNTIEQMEWGNHNQLYLFSGSYMQAGALAAGRVYRLNLDRDGAAYNGRKFVK